LSLFVEREAVLLEKQPHARAVSQEFTDVGRLARGPNQNVANVRQVEAPPELGQLAARAAHAAA
jgi:hypothetical protein